MRTANPSSLRFQGDADLNFDIIRGVRKHAPGIDFVSANDSGLRGVHDPEVLNRTAIDDRVLVSHDRGTMLKHFRNRLVSGKGSPGLLIVAQHTPISPVVEALLIIWRVSDSDELRNQVFHLPSLIRHMFPR